MPGDQWGAVEKTTRAFVKCKCGALYGTLTKGSDSSTFF